MTKALHSGVLRRGVLFLARQEGGPYIMWVVIEQLADDAESEMISFVNNFLWAPCLGGTSYQS